jgi:hypothetical protein
MLTWAWRTQNPSIDYSWTFSRLPSPNLPVAEFVNLPKLDEPAALQDSAHF